MIFTGVTHFDRAIAFDFPPGAFNFSVGFSSGWALPPASGSTTTSGYYDICYIGDEVKNPARAIPRSILLSIVCVATIYLAINLSIIGVVPWREFVPADAHPSSKFIVSLFMEKVHGRTAATFFTAAILWTAFGSVFALLLGYSRIPYAAAKDGYFFKAFARLHPKGAFPSLSLLVVGAVSIACSFFSLRRGDRRAHHHADPGPVHRADRRAHAAPAAQAAESGPTGCGSTPCPASWRWRDGSSSSQRRIARVILFGLGTLLVGVACVRDLVVAQAKDGLSDEEHR